ncbi:MAG: tRNA (guanine(46)-N(7))-methyltransferase TrmB [Magnetospiraceae bacterium]
MDGLARLYGRRKGKPLKPHQAVLMETLMPRVRLDAPAAGVRLDPARLFPFQPKAVWMEVGFGAGEHLAAQAAANPDIGFIGCEPFLNGVASLLTHMEAQELTNIRIVPDDGRPILEALPEASIHRFFLLFPDPWPKTRHHKRRFINPRNLDLLARVLTDGAELRFGSDAMPYVAWTLEHLTADERFDWLVQGPADWRARPEDWPSSRYEQKALAEGRPCAYLRFTRKPRQNT